MEKVGPQTHPLRHSNAPEIEPSPAHATARSQGQYNVNPGLILLSESDAEEPMRHESKFAAWIRSGGNSVFVLPLGLVRAPEVKFSVVPNRLLDSIIDDALVAGVARLNGFLPEGVSIDIASVDLTAMRDELRAAIADRLGETGVPVNPNDPVIKAILARYAEPLSGLFQRDALQLETYTWRSADDARVRPAHAENDDRVFAWSAPPAGGHPGQGWNCRCTAEPILDPQTIPEAAVCDLLTGDRLSAIFPKAPEDRLAEIAKEMDLRVVSGLLDTRERLIHFLAQMRQEAGSSARLVEGFNYNVRGLIATYRYFRENPEDAERFGRTEEHAAVQVAIANLALANRNGNGDAATGDGWVFRGRGLFQLTGRANYREFTVWHQNTFGEPLDFEADPDRAAEPVYAVRSAVFFWLERDIAALADQGLTDNATDAITERINRDTDSYEARRQHMAAIRDGGQFDGICRFSVARPRFEDAQ